jgi:transcription termination factor Rho
MPQDAEISLIDSSDATTGDSSLELSIKNLRQEVKDVRKDLEELQESFNSLKHSEERNLCSERTNVVSFSTVQVREYNVTMGDYRSGALQCPLTLGWEHGPSRTYDIDTFSKKKERQQHRNSLERLPLYKRQNRLRAMGHSKEEMAQTSRKERLIQLALNSCAYGRGSYASTRPREEVSLYQHYAGSLKDFQMEEWEASDEDIDDMEKIINNGENFKMNTSSINKSMHPKSSALPIAA